MIEITSELYHKLETLTAGIKTEVAGFLKGDVEDGVLVLKELVVPEQEATGGDVSIDEEALVKLRVSMTDEEWQRVVGHWHSHVEMGCFWSGTDETMIEKFSKTRRRSVFIVSSTKGNTFETLTRVVLNEPFRVDHDGVKLSVIQEEQTELTREEKLELIDEVPDIHFKNVKVDREMEGFLKDAKEKITVPKRTYSYNPRWYRTNRRNRHRNEDLYGDFYGRDYIGYEKQEQDNLIPLKDWIQIYDTYVWLYKLTKNEKRRLKKKLPGMGVDKNNISFWQDKEGYCASIELKTQKQAKKIYDKIVDMLGTATVKA